MVYIYKKYFYRSALISLILVLICLAFFSTTIGVANISFIKVIRIIASKIPLINSFVPSEGISNSLYMIILNIRMPRIFLSAIVGASLSIVGAAFQGMFKNPMADPYVLGISSGAALGATIAIVIGIEQEILNMGIITILAFVGAVVTTLIVYNIARIGNKVPSVALLLSGISVSFLLSSIISVLMVLNKNHIDKIIYWTLGSVSAASWNQVIITFIITSIGIIYIWSFSKELNILSTGEETAKSLGINVERTKRNILIVSSLIVSSCVAVSGIIGFVGLVIPHIIRILLNSDYRVVIPFSAVGGAIFMISADTIARGILPPTEIPVGAVTSLIGAPYFIYLLMKYKRKV